MKFSNLPIGLMVFLVSVSTANALDDSLIIHYSFDYVNGRTVPDISGHGLDGTIEGNPRIVEGRSGSALEFDGRDDYVIAQNKDILDSIATAVTLSAWIKTSTHAKQCIMEKVGTGGWGPGAITLEVDPHPFAKTSIWGLNPYQCVGSVFVVDDNWHHIAATWDGKAFSLYVDGFLNSTCETTGEVQPSNEAFSVAAADVPRSSKGYFHGVIDEVRVYNKALTKAEINRLLNDSLIIYYSFDYINGRTVPDISGHGLDGTIESYPEIVEGRIGSALEFDGRDDCVIAQNKDILDSIAEAVTLSAWIKTSTRKKQCIMEKVGTGGWGPGAITLEVDPHPFAKMSIWGLSPSQCVGSIVVVDNNWHHIAATWDGKAFNLYVDGFLDSTCETTGGVLPSNEAFCVAAADVPRSSKGYFHGVIDEVRVYSRALTKAEINELIEPIQEIRIQAHCPVDLVVADPWGRLVNKNESTIPDSSYIETDLNSDGILDDIVVIPQGVLGNYSIEVIPEPEVHPSDTYTLNVSYHGGSLCLAENVRVQDIPDDPYEFFFPQQSMESGWNLISLPLQPLDTTPDAVLSFIDGIYDSVWAYDPVEGWSIYAPGVFADLDEMIPGRGYWVKMREPGTLVVEGSVPEKTEIFLRGDAWNLVGYNSMNPRNAEDCMRSVESDINSVWEYGPPDVVERSWSIYTPGLPSDLEIMKPGYGYWIKAERGCEWDVNAANPPATPPLVVMPRKAYVSEDRPQIPYRLWGSVEVDGIEIATGRDNSAPTVILKVDDRIQSSYTLGSVEGYGDYYMLDAPAFGEGTLQIEIYVQMYDNLIKAVTVPPGKPGEIIRLDLSIRTSPKVSMLKQNYPNPFNPDTWIPYQLKEDTTVEVRIYTITGQLVRTLNVGYQPAGFYITKEKAAHWDGRNEADEQVASGVYFYTIKAGEFIVTRKLVVVR